MKLPISDASHRSLSFLACLILALVSCQSDTAQNSLPPPRLPVRVSSEPGMLPQKVFAPGDAVELIVEEDPSFSGDYIVREGGYVLIPKIGRVSVTGMSRESAERVIRERLLQSQLKQATVFVERRAASAPASTPGASGMIQEGRVSVFLTGAVARPGQHQIPLSSSGQPPSVFETVLIAGGLSKFADESRVHILRLAPGGGRSSTVINLEQVRAGTISDLPVGDGDIIEVKEKIFGF